LPCPDEWEADERPLCRQRGLLRNLEDVRAATKDRSAVEGSQIHGDETDSVDLAHGIVQILPAFAASSVKSFVSAVLRTAFTLAILKTMSNSIEKYNICKTHLYILYFLKLSYYQKERYLFFFLNKKSNFLLKQ